MSARALLVLIRGLPEESATLRAIRGTQWTDLMYLVAHIADTVTYARADYITAHGGTARPEPIPRPATLHEVEDKERARSVHDGLVSMMRGHPVVDAPAGDGRVYEPEIDVV